MESNEKPPVKVNEELQIGNLQGNHSSQKTTG